MFLTRAFELCLSPVQIRIRKPYKVGHVHILSVDGIAQTRPELPALSDCRSNALPNVLSNAKVRVNQNDRELVSSISVSCVNAFPDALHNRFAHIPQSLIPGDVPMGIIEPFEIIQVQENKG